MKVSDKVQMFLDKISHTKFNKVMEFINEDISIFDKTVVKGSINNSINLEYSWNSYTLSDIDITYEEDLVKFSNLIKLYGIDKYLEEILEDDHNLIITYRFIATDWFNGDESVVTGYRVIVTNKLRSYTRRIFIYG